jgi:hypothetical protein
MVRISFFARCLMAFLCMVPFTSARQTGLALAPCIPLGPVAPANQAPAPVEEDDERTSAEAKERLAAVARQRAPFRHQIGTMPSAHRCGALVNSPTHLRSASADDPFRNGLGCPYRC